MLSILDMHGIYRTEWGTEHDKSNFPFTMKN